MPDDVRKDLDVLARMQAQIDRLTYSFAQLKLQVSVLMGVCPKYQEVVDADRIEVVRIDKKNT